MPPAHVGVQVVDVEEALLARGAGLSGSAVGTRDASPRVAQLLLEGTDVRRLLPQPLLHRRRMLLGLREQGLERDVAAVEVLLHVQQVLHRHLRHVEQLAEVRLGEPVHICTEAGCRSEQLFWWTCISTWYVGLHERTVRC